MKINPTVFLIDDDTDDQEIFSLALQMADDSARCVFANDGLLALQRIKSETDFVPDYIFIDLNMPRMNGQQCLREIKKIERLKDVPVFMYSTSAEPSIVEENLKLGAVDFIVKPSDFKELINILSRIIKQKILTLLMLLCCLSFLPSKLWAQQDSLMQVKELKKLSVEELMNIVVTSVSRNSEKLSEVASAIQVVTNEEIQRSGTLRVPGFLRLATNLEVLTSGSHDTRIAARGFNGFPASGTSLTDKLLVLIDGRTVYTPLFGGVFWDVQNVLQEDVKQIEVVSGPGGAIWGSNAVNGIINIISKSAKETQGVYASAAAGASINSFGAVRYGSHVDTTLYYRVYGQRFDYASTTLSSGASALDAWNLSQGGFRMDYYPSSANSFTFQGDLYDGKENDTASTLVNGQNIVGRWKRTFSEKSGITVQAYFDRTYRNIQRTGLVDELTTWDLDVHQNLSAGSSNKLVFGFGYRLAADETNTRTGDFIPAARTLHQFNLFAQDQISLVPEHLELTLGTKVLHNDYIDLEYHPTIRLAWMTGGNHTVWTAVSRAVRTPTRLEEDDHAAGLGASGNFQSEKVIAYELGYRVRPADNISISIATYYNHYTDLRSVDTNFTPPPAFYFANNLKAETYGAELAVDAILTRWWKIHGGYSFLNEKFTVTAPTTYPQSSELEAIDPANQFLLQSLMDLTKNFQLDGTVRYTDVVPAALNLPSVPSYITFDLRLAYIYKWATVALIGSNLAEKYHGSSGNIRIPRSIYARVTVRL